jgi:hypothetical protein
MNDRYYESRIWRGRPTSPVWYGKDAVVLGGGAPSRASPYDKSGMNFRKENRKVVGARLKDVCVKSDFKHSIAESQWCGRRKCDQLEMKETAS